MRDIETRLRADAARTSPPPDFDAAVRITTARRSRSHATHASRWLAAAAVVAVVAVGANVMSAANKSSDGHPAGGGAPTSAVPASEFVSEPITGAVLMPGSSGRSLMVYATAPGKRMQGYGCVDSTHLKIVQAAAAVSLHATARLRGDGTVSCVSAGFQNPLTGSYSAGLAIQLDDPLGSRSVVDDVTGRPVAVFRPVIVHTHYLPSTYAPRYKGDALKSTHFWYDERPGFLSPIAVATEYQPTGKGPVLGIINAPTDTVNPGGTVLEHVQINGRDATVTDSPNARCVTWSPDGTTGRQVCSYTKIVDPLGDYEKGVVQLDTDELVEVARGLS